MRDLMRCADFIIDACGFWCACTCIFSKQSHRWAQVQAMEAITMRIPRMYTCAYVHDQCPGAYTHTCVLMRPRDQLFQFREESVWIARILDNTNNCTEAPPKNTLLLNATLERVTFIYNKQFWFGCGCVVVWIVYVLDWKASQISQLKISTHFGVTYRVVHRQSTKDE